MQTASPLSRRCCDVLTHIRACAKTASHVLNYCGMTAGVAGAGIAFAGAVVNHQMNQKERAEQAKQVEGLKMKTEGHDAAIEEHGQKIEQANKKFSGELALTKQTLNQVTRRIGVAKLPEDLT